MDSSKKTDASPQQNHTHNKHTQINSRESQAGNLRRISSFHNLSVECDEPKDCFHKEPNIPLTKSTASILTHSAFENDRTGFNALSKADGTRPKTHPPMRMPRPTESFRRQQTLETIPSGNPSDYELVESEPDGANICGESYLQKCYTLPTATNIARHIRPDNPKHYYTENGAEYARIRKGENETFQENNFLPFHSQGVSVPDMDGNKTFQGNSDSSMRSSTNSRPHEAMHNLFSLPSTKTEKRSFELKPFANQKVDPVTQKMLEGLGERLDGCIDELIWMMEDSRTIDQNGRLLNKCREADGSRKHELSPKDSDDLHFRFNNQIPLKKLINDTNDILGMEGSPNRVINDINHILGIQSSPNRVINDISGMQGSPNTVMNDTDPIRRIQDSSNTFRNDTNVILGIQSSPNRVINDTNDIRRMHDSPNRSEKDTFCEKGSLKTNFITEDPYEEVQSLGSDSPLLVERGRNTILLEHTTASILQQSQENIYEEIVVRSDECIKSDKILNQGACKEVIYLCGHLIMSIVTVCVIYTAIFLRYDFEIRLQLINGVMSLLFCTIFELLFTLYVIKRYMMKEDLSLTLSMNILLFAVRVSAMVFVLCFPSILVLFDEIDENV